MLSILIQLNPGYLLGITEKEPLVSHRRGTAEGVSRFRSPSQRVPGREAEAGRGGDSGAFPRDREEVGLDGVSAGALALLQTG